MVVKKTQNKTKTKTTFKEISPLLTERIRQTALMNRIHKFGVARNVLFMSKDTNE